MLIRARKYEPSHSIITAPRNVPTYLPPPPHAARRSRALPRKCTLFVICRACLKAVAAGLPTPDEEGDDAAEHGTDYAVNIARVEMRYMHCFAHAFSADSRGGA